MKGTLLTASVTLAFLTPEVMAELDELLPEWRETLRPTIIHSRQFLEEEAKAMAGFPLAEYTRKRMTHAIQAKFGEEAPLVWAEEETSLGWGPLDEVLTEMRNSPATMGDL